MSWLDTLSEIRSTDWSKVPEPERERKAAEVVTITSYASAAASGAASVVPVPAIDMALLFPIQTAMVMTVGHVLGRPLTEAEAKRVAVELGAVAGVTIAAHFGLNALKKLALPFFGGLLAAPAAIAGSFAVTWALGRVTIAYFKDPELSREELKTVFKDAFKEAGDHFSKEAFERFRKGEGADDEVEVQADPPEHAPASKPEPGPKAGPAPKPEAPKAPPQKAEAAPKAEPAPRATPEGEAEAPLRSDSVRPKKRTM
ncbi:MAG: DUF697 domain-containing protein [Myxococcales bacterium]|nr:DUF697 domain-containing protein [Myxococcales bacterium]